MKLNLIVKYNNKVKKIVYSSEIISIKQTLLNTMAIQASWLAEAIKNKTIKAILWEVKG